MPEVACGERADGEENPPGYGIDDSVGDFQCFDVAVGRAGGAGEDVNGGGGEKVGDCRRVDCR